MTPWANGIDAITLFVEDVATAKAFYVDVFALPIHYQDDNSVVFKFGDTLINLLDIAQAPGLIEPAVVAPREAGSRIQFTIGVDEVDATFEVQGPRVELLNAQWIDHGAPDRQLPRPGRHIGRSPSARGGDRSVHRG
jgi:catechol 2,3-dioxygenase-like lactoylglutathione lyase family enzyme